MLAKNVNDNAGRLVSRGDLAFLASMLAPTGVQVFRCSGVQVVRY
jgi:hypothetical protein